MEARLKKLERTNRLLCVAIGLALVPWVFGAADKTPELVEGKKGKFETIQVQKVVLVDDTGKEVGTLQGQKKGSNLTLQDGNGTTRLLIGMSEGNPSLLFANKKGNVVASYIEKDGWFETVK